MIVCIFHNWIKYDEFAMGGSPWDRPGFFVT